MHITLVDDSIAFDGYSASSRPLGGAEKAFAALPGALARRGHQVSVYNRCRWGMFVEGAQWETLDGRKPLRTDALIAFRKPELLEFVRQAGRRVLWFTGPGRLLERKPVRALLDSHKPRLLLTAQAQAAGLDLRGLTAAVMPPALRPDYLNPILAEPSSPPRAIVTTHPAHGLAWLVALWRDRIRPQVPEAELHILSATMAAAAEGGEVAEELRPIAETVLAAREHGVVISRPQGDWGMTQAYGDARVHLYPGHPDDMGCFTLMESQACGTPAVIRPLGAAPERVADGRSAYVAPDDDAFANLAALLLTDDGVRASLAAEAKALYRGRTWDKVAEKLEGFLA